MAKKGFKMEDKEMLKIINRHHNRVCRKNIRSIIEVIILLIILVLLLCYIDYSNKKAISNCIQREENYKKCLVEVQ